MELKNTDNKMIIKSKKNNQKKYIVNGIIISSLFIAIITANLAQKTKPPVEEPVAKEESIGEVKTYYNPERDYYISIYLETLRDQNKDNYDSNFINIYENGKYIINNKEYKIDELYITKLENGDTHLIKAGENRKDIITGTTFEGKKTHLSCFRDTDIFLKLYEEGKIISEEINIDNNTIQEHIKNWNGERQYKVPELEANRIAKEEFEKKYGR